MVDGDTWYIRRYAQTPLFRSSNTQVIIIITGLLVSINRAGPPARHRNFRLHQSNARRARRQERGIDLEMFQKPDDHRIVFQLLSLLASPKCVEPVVYILVTIHVSDWHWCGKAKALFSFPYVHMYYSCIHTAYGYYNVLHTHICTCNMSAIIMWLVVYVVLM